jgi:hypothetical protein
MLVAEIIKGDPKVRARPGAETGPKRLEQTVFERDYRAVIDRGWRKGVVFAVACSQQSVFDQPIRAYQKAVAGK